MPPTLNDDLVRQMALKRLVADLDNYQLELLSLQKQRIAIQSNTFEYKQLSEKIAELHAVIKYTRNAMSKYSNSH